jgi:hypothetical protein
MLSFLISSGVVASVLKSRRNSVKPVALDTVVLWDQITFDNSSTHLPFFWSNKHFLIPKNINPFALSTASLDCGWYTDENFAWVPKDLQYSLKV